MSCVYGCVCLALRSRSIGKGGESQCDWHQQSVSFCPVFDTSSPGKGALVRAVERSLHLKAKQDQPEDAEWCPRRPGAGVMADFSRCLLLRYCVTSFGYCCMLALCTINAWLGDEKSGPHNSSIKLRSTEEHQVFDVACLYCDQSSAYV
eukprot:1105589-Amphidinium_carterae.4